MYKMAVIGESWAVWGFAGLGLSVFPVDKKEEVEELLKSVGEDYAIVFVTEAFWEVVKDRFQSEYRDKFPIICLIPNNKERKNLGREAIREVVKQAVGFEI